MNKTDTTDTGDTDETDVTSVTDMTNVTDDTDTTDMTDTTELDAPMIDQYDSDRELTEIRVAVSRPSRPTAVVLPSTLVVYAAPDTRPADRTWTDDAGQHHRVTAGEPTRYYQLAEDRNDGSVERIYVREHYVDGQRVETLNPADCWPKPYRGAITFKRLSGIEGV